MECLFKFLCCFIEFALNHVLSKYLVLHLGKIITMGSVRCASLKDVSD